jgi:hypothetical protein
MISMQRLCELFIADRVNLMEHFGLAFTAHKARL